MSHRSLSSVKRRTLGDRTAAAAKPGTSRPSRQTRQPSKKPKGALMPFGPWMQTEIDARWPLDNIPRGRVKEVKTKEAFKKELEKAKHNLLVVMIFAKWCPPSRRIAPAFAELSSEYKNVVFLKVDTDSGFDIEKLYSPIWEVPTFLFLKNGRELEKFVLRGPIDGEVRKDSLRQKIRRFSRILGGHRGGQMEVFLTAGAAALALGYLKRDRYQTADSSAAAAKASEPSPGKLAEMPGNPFEPCSTSLMKQGEMGICYFVSVINLVSKVPLLYGMLSPENKKFVNANVEGVLNSKSECPPIPPGIFYYYQKACKEYYSQYHSIRNSPQTLADRMLNCDIYSDGGGTHLVLEAFIESSVPRNSHRAYDLRSPSNRRFNYLGDHAWHELYIIANIYALTGDVWRDVAQYGPRMLAHPTKPAVFVSTYKLETAAPCTTINMRHIENAAMRGRSNHTYPFCVGGLLTMQQTRPPNDTHAISFTVCREPVGDGIVFCNWGQCISLVGNSLTMGRWEWEVVKTSRELFANALKGAGYSFKYIRLVYAVPAGAKPSISDAGASSPSGSSPKSPSGSSPSGSSPKSAPNGQRRSLKRPLFDKEGLSPQSLSEIRLPLRTYSSGDSPSPSHFKTRMQRITERYVRRRPSTYTTSPSSPRAKHAAQGGQYSPDGWDAWRAELLRNIGARKRPDCEHTKAVIQWSSGCFMAAATLIAAGVKYELGHGAGHGGMVRDPLWRAEFGPGIELDFTPEVNKILQPVVRFMDLSRKSPDTQAFSEEGDRYEDRVCKKPPASLTEVQRVIEGISYVAELAALAAWLTHNPRGPRSHNRYVQGGLAPTFQLYLGTRGGYRGVIVELLHPASWENPVVSRTLRIRASEGKPFLREYASRIQGWVEEALSSPSSDARISGRAVGDTPDARDFGWRVDADEDVRLDTEKWARKRLKLRRKSLDKLATGGHPGPGMGGSSAAMLAALLTHNRFEPETALAYNPADSNNWEPQQKFRVRLHTMVEFIYPFAQAADVAKRIGMTLKPVVGGYSQTDIPKGSTHSPGTFHMIQVRLQRPLGPEFPFLLSLSEELAGLKLFAHEHWEGDNVKGHYPVTTRGTWMGTLASVERGDDGGSRHAVALIPCEGGAVVCNSSKGISPSGMKSCGFIQRGNLLGNIKATHATYPNSKLPTRVRKEYTHLMEFTILIANGVIGKIGQFRPSTAS